MTTLEITLAVEKLNKEQKATFESLVRLGDSKELALTTVFNMNPIDKKLYEYAYYN